MSGAGFIQLRLTGPRFEDGQIPLEFLGDLAALREMIIDVARWRFLQENPGRHRVPKGFAESVSLNLAGVEKGSAAPIIPYVERAMDSVVDAISSTGSDEGADVGLEPSHLAHFSRVGRGLKDGEAMEFGFPGRRPARLTQETRHRLLSKATANGIINREARYDVEFRGNQLVEANEVSLLDPLDVSARLEEFKNMKNGWFEGDGIAPSPDGLDWLASEFKRQYADDAPSPRLYPTFEGGVQAEWSFGSNAIVLEIDLSERTADWFWFDRDSDAEEERRLNLDDGDEWVWLANEVRSKAGTE